MARIRWYTWSHFAPYVGESEVLRDEFLSYCAMETKALSSNCLEVLSRIQPRSNLLLEHCLRTLDGRATEDTNASPFDRARRALVVGQILGRQFSHKDEIRAALERRLYLEDSVSIVGLSLGWPTSDALNKAYDPIRKNGWAGQRVEVGRMPANLRRARKYGRVHVSPRIHFIEWRRLSMGIPRLLRPHNYRSPETRRHFGVLFLRQIAQRPNRRSQSQPAALLVASIGLSDEIKDFCETYYAEQSLKGQLSESGLDMTAGQIRPVAHSLLDALVPRSY